MGGGQSKRKLVPNRPPPRSQVKEEDRSTTRSKVTAKQGQSGANDAKMVPPDGGWGWMIVTGTVLTVFFFPAMTVAFGVLFRERLEEMDAQETQFTIIGNLLSTVWSLVALFIAPLSELFGYRKVTILGGLLSFLTMLLSAYSTSLVSFTLSYSLLGGIAGSLSTFNGITIIPLYFQKRKGLASGIISSASAMGKIAMAPLVRLLLDTYGFRWACLIVGALSLHTIVAGLLYHPPEWHMVPAKDQTPEVESGRVHRSQDVAITDTGIVEENHRHRTTSAPPQGSIEEEEENVLFVMPSTAGASTSSTQGQKDDEVVLFARQMSTVSERSQKMRKVDSAMSLAASIPMLVLVDNKVYQDDVKEEEKQCCDDFLVVKVFRMLDYSLLRDPYFHLVAWPNALCLTAYINSLYALPGYVSSLGYTPYQSAFAISVFSFSEAILRLLISFLSDMDWFPIESAYTLGFVLGSLSMGLVPLFESYEWILACEAMNGLAMSLASVLLIHVILKYNPVESYAQIIGFFSILNGMMLLFLGSLIGFVSEVVGVGASYYVIGSIAAVSAIIWIVKLSYSLKLHYNEVRGETQ